MSSIAEIEQAIAALPPRQFAELAQWFDAERNRKWDRQIELDSESGALDPLLREVEEDIAKGRMRLTDELCDES
ncbi:MAG TPA: hypothetical protein VG733_08135 [Chthoniobacteraceae bacterium]|nr:hypothetical protein [Chthoniobacteraceae bacterium]